jgi:hypothetical protein
MPSAKRLGTTRPIYHPSQFQCNEKSLAGCTSATGAGSGPRIPGYGPPPAQRVSREIVLLWTL